MRPPLLPLSAALALFGTLAGCQNEASSSATRAPLPPGFIADVDDFWKGQRGLDSARWPKPAPLLSQDLANAEFTARTWSWAGGALAPQGPEPSADASGILWTRAPYGNFALTLEFRCTPGASGGVLLRRGNTGNWRQSALEVRILQGGGAAGKRGAGAIYGCAAPKHRLYFKPGEWQRFVIVANAGQVTVSFNGEAVTKMNLDLWKKEHLNPDGSANPFDLPASRLPRSGQIGPFVDGGSVEFRRLYVQAL